MGVGGGGGGWGGGGQGLGARGGAVAGCNSRSWVLLGCCLGVAGTVSQGGMAADAGEQATPFAVL